MIGEIAAIVAAISWAATILCLRPLIGRVSTLVVMALRSVFWAGSFWTLFLLVSPIDSLLHASAQSMVYLFISVALGAAIGDTIYLEGQRRIGVTRALPIASAYPVLTALLAFALVGEKLIPVNYLGILTVVIGSYLVAIPSAAQPSVEGKAIRSINLLGVALAVGAAVCWAISTIATWEAVQQVSVMTANAIRLPLLSAILWGAVGLNSNRTNIGQELRRLTRDDLLLLVVAGASGSISSVAYLYSLSIIGAGKTATISSAAPIFAAPVAALLFKEKLTPRVLLGTLLSVAGVWLVIL